MAHYNQPQKNPPWVRNNVQQQPILAQQMTVQSVALSQPTLATTHIAPQNSIGQVQITPAIQSHQVQLPLTQTHLLLNQPLTQAFGQQVQLANIGASQQPASTHQTYFTPSISLQQNVGLPQGTIQIQPPSLVIPSSVATSIAPPGIAISSTLATVHPNTTATYTLSRLAVAPPQLPQQQLQQQQQHQQQQQQHQQQQQQQQQQHQQQQQQHQHQHQHQQHQHQHQHQQQTVKQRVFSGLVTKLHENFGFIDEDVIFQSSVVKGTAPQIGDRVLVEASFNGSMPFKWNATRVQVIAQSSNQKTVATVTDTTKQMNRDWCLRSRGTAEYRDSDRPARESRRRTSRSSSRSPNRKRSRSPHGSPRRRNRSTRYSVQIPKVSLDCREANLMELRRRYSHMYIPSDFLSSANWWLDSFPIQRPFPLGKSVSYHIFDKDVDPPCENDAILEPPDADYLYSAKVMLVSLPSINDMMKKCCPEEEKDDFVHPARLIRFLVGQRGKNETMAIGGPWSPSLDGPDPEKDPQVLVKTAIRTCKALTGIDLTSCTRWYRVTEVRYRRKERVETVLVFVPDVWSCVPTPAQWEHVVRRYIQATSDEHLKGTEDDGVKAESEQPKSATHFSKMSLCSLKSEELRSELEARNLNSQGDKLQLLARLTIATRSEAEDERRSKETTDEGSADQSPGHSDEAEDKMDFASSPKLLVHPSRTFKGGKFTCSVVSLSVLLDYRLEDTKEHTFEVSLFSEVFNEMLMRDFGALVYRSVMNEALRKDKKKDADEENEKKKAMKEARLMIHTNVPPLLAYSYFDLSHCNYIASKDLEDLFLTLGLQLSRAQVRKTLQKVIADDSLRYRKLVEKNVSNGDADDQDNHQTLHIRESSGEECSIEQSRNLSNDNGQAAVTMSNGCYVNVEQLISRLEQSEESRRESENQLKFAQQQLATCRSDLVKADETIASLHEQLANEKLKTETAVNQLNKLQESFNKYSEAIAKIHKVTNTLSSDVSLKDENLTDNSI